MENNVTCTTTTTIQHCGTKIFPSSSPPQDMINNNSSMKHKSFKPTIISNTNDLQNNELKNLVSSSNVMTITVTTSSNDSNDCLDVGSMPDADLTESLATATEALTEILVKSAANILAPQDVANGNTLPKQHPNVSSSSTQTECPPSSSYHLCCCNKEWNCWKLAANDKIVNEKRCDNESNKCCQHNRRKKTCASVGRNSKNSSSSIGSSGSSGYRNCSSSSNSSTSSSNSSVDIVPEKINSCDSTATGSKYSKNWRELRKATTVVINNNCNSCNNKRPNVICRFQSSKNRCSSKPVV